LPEEVRTAMHECRETLRSGSATLEPTETVDPASEQIVDE